MVFSLCCTLESPGELLKTTWILLLGILAWLNWSAAFGIRIFFFLKLPMLFWCAARTEKHCSALKQIRWCHHPPGKRIHQWKDKFWTGPFNTTFSNLSIWLLHPQGSFTSSMLSQTELLIVPQMPCSVHITTFCIFCFLCLKHPTSSFCLMNSSYLSFKTQLKGHLPRLSQPWVSCCSLLWDPRAPCSILV